MKELDWIAVDWGTSHLRLWGMSGDQPLWQAQSADGMGGLDRAGFEPALLRKKSVDLGRFTVFYRIPNHTEPAFFCSEIK